MPHSSLQVPEVYIQRLRTDDPGAEEPAHARERLKAAFPAGATRRMTTLGLIVGASVSGLEAPGMPVVYATSYAESRALEGFLDSFPAPSPTLFQTSIHPSAVQQTLIARQQSVGEFIPLSGGELLAFHSLRASMVSPWPEVVLCGGEERGAWLLQYGLASSRTFGFAALLGRARQANSVARISVSAAEATGTMGLGGLFDLLHNKRPFAGAIAPGWHLGIEWL